MFMIYRSSLSRLKHFYAAKKKPSQVWGQDSSNRSDKTLRVYYSGFARQALAEGLDLLEIGVGHNVLVPAYICYGLIEPFRLKGVEVRYYNINKDFSADLKKLSRLMDKDTKALLYVNYFGLMNNFKEYQSFCQDNGLYFIEDNAHLLLPDYRHAKGDISIFSLRKFYPVPNGAVLVVRDSRKSGLEHSLSECVEKIFHLADYKFLVDTLLRRVYNYFFSVSINKILIEFRKTGERSAPEYAATEDILLYKRILASSFNIINNIDFHTIYTKRRDNYNLLLNRLLSLNSRCVKVIFSRLSPDKCPMAFPLLVERDSKAFTANLQANGYAAYPWPDIPDEIITNSIYENEQYLSNSVILLPIHEDIRKEELERMALTIKEWTDKVDRKN